MESLELCTHWVMESFVAIHYTAKAFYVLGFSIWGLGQIFRYILKLKITKSITLLPPAKFLKQGREVKNSPSVASKRAVVAGTAGRTGQEPLWAAAF